MTSRKNNPYSFFAYAKDEENKDSDGDKDVGKRPSTPRNATQQTQPTKAPSIFDDSDSDDTNTGPPLQALRQKQARLAQKKQQQQQQAQQAAQQQQQQKKVKTPRLVEEVDVSLPPILPPAVEEPKHHHRSHKQNPEPPVSPPVLPDDVPLPPPQPPILPMSKDDDDDDDDDDDLFAPPPLLNRGGTGNDDVTDDDDDDDDDFGDSVRASPQQQERIAKLEQELSNARIMNDKLKALALQQKASLAERTQELKEMSHLAKVATDKAVAAEERLRVLGEKEAEQNKVFDQLLQRVEANLAAANARAAQAEAEAANLRALLAAEKAKVTQLEEVTVSPADFPNWPAARACIISQRALLSQARQRGQETAHLVEEIANESAKHLVEVAKAATALKEVSQLMASFDKVLDVDDGSSTLLHQQ